MIKIKIIERSIFKLNIEEIAISFIKNPRNGGIPARDKKFIKIKRAINGFKLEKKSSLMFLIGENIRDKIIEIEILEYKKK